MSCTTTATALNHGAIDPLAFPPGGSFELNINLPPSLTVVGKTVYLAMQSAATDFSLDSTADEITLTGAAAVTVSTITAADEVVTTSSAHGLSVGDRVYFSSLTSGTGLTDDTIYYVVTVPTTTTATVSATSGGSAVDITVDYDGGSLTLASSIAIDIPPATESDADSTITLATMQAYDRSQYRVDLATAPVEIRLQGDVEWTADAGGFCYA